MIGVSVHELLDVGVKVIKIQGMMKKFIFP